jgi:hypothetical protein
MRGPDTHSQLVSSMPHDRAQPDPMINRSAVFLPETADFLIEMPPPMGVLKNVYNGLKHVVNIQEEKQQRRKRVCMTKTCVLPPPLVGQLFANSKAFCSPIIWPLNSTPRRLPE